MPMATGLCTVCSQPATLMCQRCFSIYCTVQCQIYDWPQHKLVCIIMPKLVPAVLPMSNAPDRSALLGGTFLVEVTNERRSVFGVNLELNQPQRSPSAPVEQVQDETIEKICEESENFTKPPPPITMETAPVDDISKAHETVSESSGKEPAVATSVVEVEAKPIEVIEPKNWLQTRSLNVDKNPLEIVIHCVGDDGFVWVIESGWEVACNKLLHNTNKHCLANQAAKASPTDIVLDNIFGVNFEGAFYRAVVTKILDGGQVKVQLIDYGNEFLVQTNALLLPSPMMKSVAPFAVKAQLKGAKTVQVEDRHVVIVVNQDPVTRVYELEVFKSRAADVIDLLAPKESLTAEQGVLTIFALPKKTLALGILSAEPLKQVIQQLILELPKLCVGSAPHVTAAVGDVVCCQLPNKTWGRVKVVHKQADNYVVFGLDSGSFDFVTGAGCFKACPDELAQIPSLTVLIDFHKLLVDAPTFYKSHCFPFVDLPITMREYVAEQREIVVTVQDKAGQQLAEACVRTYNGTLEGLGLLIWRSVAPDHSEVMITDIVNEQALHLCPVDKCGVYHEFFQQFAGKMTAYTKTPNVGDYVLATSKTGDVYRAKIQAVVSAVLAQVVDLDSGVVEELDFKRIAPATDFVKALPVYTMLVKVDGVGQLSIEDRILVAEYWKEVMESKKTLIMSYDGAYQLGVKLLNGSTKKDFMLDVEEAKKAMQAEQVLKEQPTKDKEQFMLNDLAVREISVGSNVKVSLIDISAINAGQLTVCEYHKDNVVLYEKITKAVNDYGKSQAAGDAYYPKKGELCIAIFPADNEWYRAVSVTETSVTNPKARLLFVDYCNEETIDCKNIRQMAPNLMKEAVVAHLVKVEGVELPASKKLLAKLCQWQDEGSFITKAIEKRGDVYHLTMPEC